MKNPLDTIEQYELFLYTLKEAFPSIKHSTIVLILKKLFSYNEQKRELPRERYYFSRTDTPRPFGPPLSRGELMSLCLDAESF
jgi:hypothetical protein